MSDWGLVLKMLTLILVSVRLGMHIERGRK
jgi:hypothetical protein